MDNIPLKNDLIDREFLRLEDSAQRIARDGAKGMAKIENALHSINFLIKDIITNNLPEILKLRRRNLILNVWESRMDSKAKSSTQELDELQILFVKMFDFIERAMSIIDRLDSYASEKLNSIKMNLTIYMSELVEKGFQLENHPPLVVSMNSKINLRLRHLLPHVIHSMESVEMHILTEEQTRTERVNRFKTCGSLEKRMKFRIDETDITVEENNTGLKKAICILNGIQFMNLPGIDEQQESENIYHLLFKTKVKAFDLKIDSFTMSSMFITKNSDDPDVWSTVMWNHLISDKQNYNASWTEIGKALKIFFEHYTNGCELNEGHIKYLHEKAFENQAIGKMRTFQELCREKIPKRNFTFWTYFFEAAKLTRDHLHLQWRNKCIIGFISRNDAVKILRNSQTETFLLRFPDSIVGSITVARIYLKGPEKTIDMVEPYRYNEFNKNVTIFGLVTKLRGCSRLYDANGTTRTKIDNLTDYESPEFYSSRSQ